MKNLFICVLILTSFSTHAILPDGKGDQAGLFLSFMLPVEKVKTMLPKGLELVPVKGAPAGQHPVTIFAGRQYNVTALMWGKPVNTIAQYDEFIYSITSVKHVNHPQIYTFTPHIYVSSLRAKLAGDVYGLVKTYLPPSQFHYLGSDFGQSATSLNGSEVKLPSGEVMIATGLVPPLAERMKETAQFKANYEFVVGNTKNIIVSTIFGFQCIVMDQGFNSAKARKSVLPSTGAVMIPKSAKIMVPANKLTNMLSQDAFGAFIIQTSWTMEAPKACW